MKTRIVAVLLVCLAGPAFGQERDPGQRQLLVDLSRVLGEAHALRLVCNGAQDQFWRDRMMAMLANEDADFAFSERLRGAFNTGFVGARDEHLACTKAARDDEERVSAQGQALARRLSQGAAVAPDRIR
jgi:uncharacterized protein (TIGR02301 family)